MDINKIYQFIEEFKKLLVNAKNYEPLAIISHDNVDLDGAASILGVYLIFKRFSSFNSRVYPILKHTNQFVKQILDKFPFIEQFRINEAQESYNTVILVDTPYIPPYFTSKFSKLLVIDHHLEQEYMEEDKQEFAGFILEKKIISKLIDSSASSCSEMISQIWQQLETQIPQVHGLDEKQTHVIAQLLLSAILLDSAGLRFSENNVLSVLEFLTQKGADLKIARSLSIREIPLDETIARIKGAVRSEEPIFISKWIVLITMVNSHESAVCNALLGLGADLGFCISKRKNSSFRIIARASERFQLETEFHLAKFMEKLAMQYKGNFGGHKGAAGMNGQGISTNLKEQLISELKKELNDSILYKSDPA